MHHVSLFLPQFSILQSFILCPCCNCLFATFVLSNLNIKPGIYHLIVFVRDGNLRHIINVKTLLKSIRQTKLLHLIALGIHLCSHQEIKCIVFPDAICGLLILAVLCLFPCNAFVTCPLLCLRLIHFFIAKTCPHSLRLFFHHLYTRNMISDVSLIRHKMPLTRFYRHLLFCITPYHNLQNICFIIAKRITCKKRGFCRCTHQIIFCGNFKLIRHRFPTVHIYNLYLFNTQALIHYIGNHKFFICVWKKFRGHMIHKRIRSLFSSNLIRLVLCCLLSSFCFIISNLCITNPFFRILWLEITNCFCLKCKMRNFQHIRSIIWCIRMNVVALFLRHKFCFY